MKKIGISIVLLLVTLVATLSFPNVSYAKLLPRYKNAGGSSSAPVSAKSYAGVSVSPSFMSGRGGLKVVFGNVKNAKKVSYTLVYETNGKQEGVSGSVSPSDGPAVTRNLQFATCSSGTCVNHGKISNMQFTVTSELTSGKTSIKKYRIKV